MVQSTIQRLKGDKPPTSETRFYLTNLQDVQRAAHAVRSHWGIENSVHWVLDVVFKEDDWATKSASAAANLSVIRRLTANLLKAETSSGLSGPQKRYQSALNPDYLYRVIFGSSLISQT